MINIKQLLLIWMCALADICIYSLCIFLIIKEYSAIFWVSYISTTVAFVLYSAAIFVIGKKGRRMLKMKSAVYLNIGLGLQIFVGSLFMFLPVSICIVSIIEVLLQVFFIIGGIYILLH